MMGDLSACAHELLAVAPLVMKAVRVAMRDQGPGDLSVSQFMALSFLDQHDGASLSELADHLGFQLPSASRLVDCLVEQGLLTRRQRAENRRCVSLAVTARGRAVSQAALTFAERYVGERLAPLAESDQAEVLRSLRMLCALFAGDRRPAARAGSQAAALP
jgi:DNA-binding MarR family transcriptional regulator